MNTFCRSKRVTHRWTRAVAASVTVALIGGSAAWALQDDASTTSPDPNAAEVKAIQDLGRALVAAYDAGDAAKVAALFVADAEVVGDSGAEVRGPEEIQKHFTSAFQDRPGEKLELESLDIRFFGPDLARETGRSRTVSADGKSEEYSGYEAILVKRDGKWLHASVREFAEEIPTPHGRLEELAWMVGDWVDENDEAVVHTSCRWSDDGNFLLRDFSIQVAGDRSPSGSQRIGWDEAEGCFKSWVFDSDGGHSEGVWNRGGPDEWVVRARGVLADGRRVEATQVLTRTAADRALWQSINRSIGGETLPDSLEVTLVRTPPEPETTTPPAKRP